MIIERVSKRDILLTKGHTYGCPGRNLAYFGRNPNGIKTGRKYKIK